MKRILATHIDTGSHGYISVSKSDIKELGIQNEISGCSGLSLKRVYLEEDADGTLFAEACAMKGIKLYVRESYNQKFKISHNYNPQLFDWVPKLKDIVICGSREFEIIWMDNKTMMVVAGKSERYYISKINPFKVITGIKQS